MAEKTLRDRVIMHDELGAMEADFSDMTLATVADVDAYYDEADRRLAETGKRWYFLVNYTNCVIAPEAWDRFAERGKHTNITYGLGTVRIGTSRSTRETIQQRAQREMFRTNIYDNRDQALLALGEMRKRREALGEEADATGAYLRVEDVHLSFGGVKAISAVGFDVAQGEISSIIGPNGAGKSSMLNVISGFYRPQKGRIYFEGRDRTHLPAHEVARLGFARTFQNIALFKGMTTLDNIMTGRTLKMKTGFFWQLWRHGPAMREEVEHRHVVEEIIDFLEIQAHRKTPVGRLPYGLQKRVDLGRALAMEPRMLLLDEPMAGMNIEEKQDMSRFILDVNDEFGTTIVLIEHDMGVVMDISDRVVVLDYGKKIGDGTPDEVRQNEDVIRAYLGVSH